ncbi:T9SS type A sorting domain-containing protein [Hymenobacter guriensis]|uniref:T9SS type A sorting domain-containing protein n=1 Tax=Hymenobacter guriensis TaxID=2793065 RepID=A0ABS0KX14_9BACT|nr:T9SS type A sorting domain-containing protein [Hymenobacter guriensis]MBG8552406.1 T9SS type A sorting domain-containing protein [Hymenobacter guriensis]
MKILCRLLLAAGLLLSGSVTAQNWRPFRPGLIYTYQSADHSMRYLTRLDSAFKEATDSVYQFRRLMRPEDVRSSEATSYYATPNGLLAARLVVQPGTSAFRLIRLADRQTAALDLLIRPQTRENGSWQASREPDLQATITSRSRELVFGVLDSVLTVRLSSGAELRLSKAHGLLEGPLGLETEPTTALVLQAAIAPHPWAEADMYPTRALNWQVGDEFGSRTFYLYGLPCQTTYTLRRITARTQTADTLAYELLEQSITRQTGPCSIAPPSAVYSAVRKARWAVSLRTGEWQGAHFPSLSLLTWEYEPRAGSIENLASVAPVAMPRQLTQEYGLTNGWLISYALLFPDTRRPGFYKTGLDLLGLRTTLAAPFGAVSTPQEELRYYRRCTAGGSCQEWGEKQEFYLLLPTAIARQQPASYIYPNPAANQAILSWNSAGPSGAICLLDAMGRVVHRQAIKSGQNVLSLQGLQAGVYMVEIRSPTAPIQRLRLLHE